MRICHPDVLIGFGLALFAGMVLWLIRQGIGPFDYEASILPSMGAGCLLFLSVALAASALGGAGKSLEDGASDHPLHRTRLLRLVAAAGIAALHAFLLESFGVLLVGFSLQLCLYLLLGRRPFPAAAVSAATVAALYGAIDLLLGVPLPKGDLW
ncbi:tripartite tricarboxylate transporter TctB family protein [Nisaea acidiphila]|uniref:Tripartite tricarboxylate transporter TctB family protein n=1 Tax=Nisaea acidiphila TaxID=1862145 RepID=A0A9J7AMT6_9PROT|nr:tripartite tricarboxylate transporter TctB family protein [Nisaea acidiphila]UUX48266.1 tripartite tricarboxylate transporter TctB family protein [Nisaea acidiphila]